MHVSRKHSCHLKVGFCKERNAVLNGGNISSYICMNLHHLEGN